MELLLAHKIFEDVHKYYDFEDAKKKAFLFVENLDDVEELGGDYWIQIAENWDLNVHWDDCTSCEFTLYPCTIGPDGFFHDDMGNGYNITKIEPKNFPVDEKKLKDFLEYFENVEYHNTGVHYISGGFTLAEYDGYEEDNDDDPHLYIVLKWGVQNDVENNVNTEYYSILIDDFNKATNNQEIYKLLDN